MAKKATRQRKPASPKKPKVTRPPRKTSEQIEASLADSALAKYAAGKTPTAQEIAALRKRETAKEEEQRWEYYCSIPQRHWLEMAGRQAKVVNEQSSRYGIPFSGRVVDLPRVVRALHDFFAKHHRKLAAAEDNALDSDDPLLAGANSPALERYREEQAKIAKIKRLELERQLLPRDLVHSCLTVVASLVRTAGDQLEKSHGPEAADLLHAALDDAQREIEKLCHDPTDDDLEDDGCSS